MRVEGLSTIPLKKTNERAHKPSAPEYGNMGGAPKFFVALAHTDTVACYTDAEGTAKERVSVTNLFPRRLTKDLLFSLSFNAEVHYTTKGHLLDPLATHTPSENQTRSMFADCGAFQFRNESVPMLDNAPLNADVAWERYSEAHLNRGETWDELLLCSPDHIITQDMDDDEAESRHSFIEDQASRFLDLCSSRENVHAVGVIHGRNNAERMKQYENFKSLGYQYVALGGMVPYSTKPNQVLDIIAGIKNQNEPLIDPNSILARCRQDGIRLHIFGLNSPEWVRWWYRLRIDSFDGSKLSTEGAANGWYYIPKDGKGKGRDLQKKPGSVKELYHRIPVKRMLAEKWEWGNSNDVMRPINVDQFTEISTECDCDACLYLKSARCTSRRCWITKKESNSFHAADPRTMGSTEHNMGRVAHNAHVFDWLIEQIENYNKLADNSTDVQENSWLRNWTTVEVGS